MKTVFIALFAAGVGMAAVQSEAAPSAGTWKEKVLYSFCSLANCADGVEPYGNLIEMNGMLYGMTEEGGSARLGTVFSLDPNTGVETVLHSFTGGTDGESPIAGLIAVKGLLYGTTWGGGGRGCRHYEGCGIVFSIGPGNGVETILYSFGGRDGKLPNGNLLNVDGTLYGTTVEGGIGHPGWGTVFSLDPTTGAEAVVFSFDGSDGAIPRAAWQL